MVPKENDKVEKYIGGLLDSIQGNVIVVEPVRFQDAICIANNLMDQKLKGYAIKNAENKRSLVPEKEVEFRRISLTGFHSCTSRSHYRSVSKLTTWISQVTYHKDCLMLALEGFPSSM
ncbi:hypothetical protein Tco_1054606 [Tanacetum coccineum]|uniref:Uncharacterized protein n=1 Tax=Tanacetum coccineum TaxID=301880 RepID=A0ABQ5GYB5_9ASTR